jgi:hypothetical protein
MYVGGSLGAQLHMVTRFSQSRTSLRLHSFTNIAAGLNSSGQGVGSVWLWLLPIVMGRRQISPKCDYDRVKHAIVPRILQVGHTPDGVKASEVSNERTFSMQEHHQEFVVPRARV